MNDFLTHLRGMTVVCPLLILDVLLLIGTLGVITLAIEYLKERKYREAVTLVVTYVVALIVLYHGSKLQ